MAIKKLSLEDFIDEADFTLIGIHTSIEYYRLAYLLKTKLNFTLSPLRYLLKIVNNTLIYYSFYTSVFF